MDIFETLTLYKTHDKIRVEIGTQDSETHKLHFRVERRIEYNNTLFAK